MPLVQAGRPALLQCGSALSLLQDLWPFLMEKPQNLLSALHGLQAPTASLSPEQEWLYPLGIRLRSHLLWQELPGLHTQDITYLRGSIFIQRVVPALNVGKDEMTQLSSWEVRVWGATHSMDVLIIFFSQRGSQHPAQGGGDLHS